jgi:RNA polymerase sigma-70 factor (family 1)
MKTQDFDQEETMKALASGCEIAFAKIFKCYYPRVYNVGYDFFHSRELAKEVAQEVFIKVWDRRIAFADVKTLEAFIYTMTKNLALNLMKSRSRELLNAYKFAITRDTTENLTEKVVLNNECDALVNDAVEKLTPNQKRVYELSRVQGLSHREIAQRLNVSDSTVNNLLNTALAKLRKDLKPYVGCTLPLFSVLSEIFKGIR